jgi:hypothetical protein
VQIGARICVEGRGQPFTELYFATVDAYFIFNNYHATSRIFDRHYARGMRGVAQGCSSTSYCDINYNEACGKLMQCYKDDLLLQMQSKVNDWDEAGDPVDTSIVNEELVIILHTRGKYKHDDVRVERKISWDCRADVFFNTVHSLILENPIPVPIPLPTPPVTSVVQYTPIRDGCSIWVDNNIWKKIISMAIEMTAADDISFSFIPPSLRLLFDRETHALALTNQEKVLSFYSKFVSVRWHTLSDEEKDEHEQWEIEHDMVEMPSVPRELNFALDTPSSAITIGANPSTPNEHLYNVFANLELIHPVLLRHLYPCTIACYRHRLHDTDIVNNDAEYWDSEYYVIDKINGRAGYNCKMRAINRLFVRTQPSIPPRIRIPVDHFEPSQPISPAEQMFDISHIGFPSLLPNKK